MKYVSSYSVPLIFVDGDGFKNEIQAQIGEDLLSLAHHNDIDMEGACEGNMACATCHIVVDPDWSGKLTPPREEEEDMLDLVPGLRRTSRLGCQIIMTPGLDGLVVHLPGEDRNFLDH